MPTLAGAMAGEATTKFNQVSLCHGKGNHLRRPAVGTMRTRFRAADCPRTCQGEFLDEGLCSSEMSGCRKWKQSTGDVSLKAFETQMMCTGDTFGGTNNITGGKRRRGS
jgi:hypothetical protein